MITPYVIGLLVCLLCSVNDFERFLENKQNLLMIKSHRRNIGKLNCIKWKHTHKVASYRFLQNLLLGVYVRPVSPCIIYDDPVNVRGSDPLDGPFVEEPVFENKHPQPVNQLILVYGARLRLCNSYICKKVNLMHRFVISLWSENMYSTWIKPIN